jgi:RNA polymerase sigma-70 factor (ECF subfamily)
MDDVQELLQRRRYDEALERLLDVYGNKVFRMAFLMLKDRGRAEEVTQDIFVKFWRALPGYDGRAAPSTWLYAIARNTCLSAVRSESYRKAAPLETAPEPRTPSAPTARLELEQGLARLPEEQRQALTLFYLEDRSTAEVARLLDLPEGTVKSHLHRARRALGKALGPRMME